MEIEEPFLNMSEEQKESYIPRILEHIEYATEEIKRGEKDIFGRANDLKNAWDYLEFSKETPLCVDKIIQLGNLVSESNPYISRGYRHIGEMLYETNVPICPPSQIQDAVKNLVDNYHKDSKELDPFERESKFFLQMIRIHPFEDGNRRTAFLLVNHHLLEGGYAPVYLDEDAYDTYLSSIHDNDLEKMTQIFKEQSRKEASWIMENNNQKIRK